MSRVDALEAAARALNNQTDSLRNFMGPGSLGVPLPVGLGPAGMLAPLESPGWGQTLVSMQRICAKVMDRVGGGATLQWTHGSIKMHAVRPLPASHAAGW
jgi:hypothetical protein